MNDEGVKAEQDTFSAKIRKHIVDLKQEADNLSSVVTEKNRSIFGEEEPPTADSTKDIGLSNEIHNDLTSIAAALERMSIFIFRI